MYLVHATLVPLPPPRPLPQPARLSDLLYCCTRQADGLEHVSFHPTARPYPVVGLYLLVDGLAVAEAVAAALIRHALARHPELHGWRLLRAEVPLLPHPARWGADQDG